MNVLHFTGRYRLPFLGAAVALVLGATLLWALRAPDPNPRLEALRKKGYPVTLAELDAWYPPVPDNTNAALVYGPLFASPSFTNAVAKLDDLLSNTKLPARGQRYAPADAAGLTAFFCTNESLFHPLYVAAGASRYPVDLKQGFETEVPHLQRIKSSVILLGTSALLHAGKGESEPALRDLTAAGRVADSLSEEPLLISHLVRIAGWTIVLQRLERVLSLTSLSEAQLAQLQALVQGAEKPQGLARAMGGEQAAGLGVFQQPARFFGAQIKPGTTPSLGERLRMTLLVDGLKASGFLAKDKAFYLDAMAANLAASELPPPARIQACRQTVLVPSNRLYIFSSMLLPALSRACIRDADFCARLRTTQTALAIERFRLAHTNTLPASLQALVPAYLSAVPSDPYDGQVLRYKLRPTGGYVVYSLGEDGKDDGGQERNPNNGGRPHDLTFILDQ